MPGQKLHQQFVGLPFNGWGIEIDLEYIAFLFYLVPLGPGDYPYLNSFRQWLLLLPLSNSPEFKKRLLSPRPAGFTLTRFC